MNTSASMDWATSVWTYSSVAPPHGFCRVLSSCTQGWGVLLCAANGQILTTGKPGSGVRAEPAEAAEKKVNARQIRIEAVAQGLKPNLCLIAFAARLKSCPDKKQNCKCNKTRDEFYGLPPIGQKQRRPMDGAQFHPPRVGNDGG
ncbi:MAG TPA: hypothetical protein VMA34_08010, partial [Terracidiphilus sp.]|nr:hypothetical protein [Terracidiphilus sp.]